MLLADDAKLYSRIYIDQPSIFLQHLLDCLSSWADSWQLAINISKCCVISTCFNKAVSSNKYYLDRNLIPSTTYTFDLGNTITNNLSFHTHFNNIVSKALQRNSIFFRGFVSRNLSPCRKAFITYIRPLLEYNSVVWIPTHIFTSLTWSKVYSASFQNEFCHCQTYITLSALLNLVWNLLNFDVFVLIS